MAIRSRFNLFDWALYLFMGLLCFTTFYPFWHQFVISISTPASYYRDWYHLWPSEFSLQAYVYNFQNPQVFRSFLVSVYVTAAGTVCGLSLAVMAGYFLSKSNLRGRNLIFLIFIIPNFIGGGLIPFYVLVSKLGMRNTYLALFIPYLLQLHYIVLIKNYFQHLPQSLEESARIDGANDIVILLRIVVPTAKPMLATIGLFYAVSFWNDWFPGMIFLSDTAKAPLSLYLRSLVLQAASSIQIPSSAMEMQAPATVRAAVIMITILPIICIYPFLQKHFVKGIMLGAIRE